jgi:folate-dependent phosphoribosylglycinamide formyltransferase PurN
MRHSSTITPASIQNIAGSIRPIGRSSRGETENAGVTLHAVDAGVYTGGVIYQAPVAFDPQDKIASYQTLQAARGIPLFTRASADALSGYFETFAVDLPSQNRLPPRIWCYFCNGLSKGVW